MIERERGKRSERERESVCVCMNEGKKEEIDRECVHECDYAVD